MQYDVILPVVREDQLQFYTCGAACINIVLSHWAKNHLQADVWQAVQNNTVGPRPMDAPPPDAGSFASQYCDRCSNKVVIATDGTTHGDYSCWYTTPEAMAATINASSSAPVTADYIADGSDAIRRLADSLATFDVPAVFTTLPALHWVVAYGYQHDDVPPTVLSYVKWNNQYVTGIYVHDPTPVDPATGGTLTVQMVTPRGLDGLLMSIECGSRVGEHPIVGGAVAMPGGGGGGGGSGAGGGSGGSGGGSSGPDPLIGPWVTFVATVFMWLDPRRWFRYFMRPRRPGPPPR